MDLAYWGFAYWPFQSRRSIDRSPHGASQEEAFARLLFLIDERRHYGLLTGAPGTGKSCLLQLAKAYSARHGHRCVEIDCTGMLIPEFAQSIATETPSGCELDASASHCWSQIRQLLLGQALVNQPLTILIDHYDLAAEPLAPQVRRLANFSVQAGAALTILISSRSADTLSGLRDELDLSVKLTGWSADETSQFIADSLKAAGAKAPVFSMDAAGAVHSLAAGNPAQVIRICDLALLAAMNDGRYDVDAAIVEAAVAELSPSPFDSTSPVKQYQSAGDKTLV